MNLGKNWRRRRLGAGVVIALLAACPVLVAANKDRQTPVNRGTMLMAKGREGGRGGGGNGGGAARANDRGGGDRGGDRGAAAAQQDAAHQRAAEQSARQESQQRQAAAEASRRQQEDRQAQQAARQEQQRRADESQARESARARAEQAAQAQEQQQQRRGDQARADQDAANRNYDRYRRAAADAAQRERDRRAADQAAQRQSNRDLRNNNNNDNGRDRAEQKAPQPSVDRRSGRNAGSDAPALQQPAPSSRNRNDKPSAGTRGDSHDAAVSNSNDRRTRGDHFNASSQSGGRETILPNTGWSRAKAEYSSGIASLTPKPKPGVEVWSGKPSSQGQSASFQSNSNLIHHHRDAAVVIPAHHQSNSVAVFSHHFHDPQVFHHRFFQPSYCYQPFFGYRSYAFCAPAYSCYSYCYCPGYFDECFDHVGFFFGDGHYSLSFSFCDYTPCYDPCYYRPFRYYHYDNGCGYPRYRHSYFDCDWYSCARPYYGCYRPRYTCYQPLYTSYTDYSYLDEPSYPGPYDYYNDSAEPYVPPYLPPVDAAPSDGDYSPPLQDIAPAAPVPTDGWDLLVAGNAREARRVFDRGRNVHPNDGLANIGYAIAAGLLSRYDDATASMRIALRNDPESLNEVPDNAKIEQGVRQLLDYYVDRIKSAPGDVDALFMSAALRFLVDDEALAYFAADRAIEKGDKDVSVLNLKRLIQSALDKDSQKHQAEPAPSVAPSDRPAAIPSEQPAASKPSTVPVLY